MSGQGELARPGTNAKGEFAGPLSETQSRTLRFEAASQEESTLRKWLNEESDPEKVGEVQRILYTLVQEVDSDAVADSAEDQGVRGRMFGTLAVGYLAIIAALWTGTPAALAPVSVVLKDPQKVSDQIRARKQNMSDRVALRDAIAKVHALATAKLKELKYRNHVFDELPEQPGKVQPEQEQPEEFLDLRANK